MDSLEQNIPLFIAVILLGVVALFFLIDLIFSIMFKNAFRSKDWINGNSVFGCKIDFSKNLVVLFNRKKIGKKASISLEEFYKLFHNKDSSRVSSWLASIRKGEDSDIYLETEVANGDNHYFFCLIKSLKYDQEFDFLYLEFYKFSNMPSSQGRKKEKNKLYSLAKRNQIESYFSSLKKKRGYIFAINFFFNGQEVISSETIEKNILMKFKNEVYSFMKAYHYYRFILDEYDNRIYLYDFKMKSEGEAEKLANEMISSLVNFIFIKGYSEYCGVSIGITNVASSENFDYLMKMSLETAESAQTNNLPFLFSDHELENLKSYDSDLIDKVFKEGSLSCLFRPIINVTNDKTVGYFGNVSCQETSFKNYYEISRYVNKVDRNKELLSSIIERFTSKFYFERPSNTCKLFIQISLVDLGHLCKVLTNIPHAADSGLVLMFEESEVNANAFSLSLLASHFSELKSLGYNIALLLKDENTLLESDFYYNFNYFVIGSSMVSKVKESSRYRLSNKYLIESLLQYKRPIVITDLDGWASIELFVKSGCTLLSSDDISPSSEMILPIDASKITRIKKIK